MGRPSTPHTKKSEGTISRINKSPVPTGSKSLRIKSFMAASRESLGFAFLNEKRIAQRYNRKKKRKSLQICDSVNNICAVDVMCKSNKDTLSRVKKLPPTRDSVINIDYEKIQEERQMKLEELQGKNMDEDEVKKRKKKRNKITK